MQSTSSPDSTSTDLRSNSGHTTSSRTKWCVRRLLPSPRTLTPRLSTLQPVALNKPPSFTIREDRARMTTESWRQWAEQREVDEWIAGVAGVLEHGFSEQLRIALPPSRALS